MVRQLLKHYSYMVIIFFIGRCILFITYFDYFKDSGVDYWWTFLHGLRMDTIVASIFLVIPSVLLCFSSSYFKKGIATFLKYYFVFVFIFIIYIENATFSFLAQYDVRPNYLFVEYLIYPKEVFAMIFADYKKELLFSFIMMMAFSYGYLKNNNHSFIGAFDIHYAKRLVLFLPISIILIMGIRSSFGHRAASLSDALYTSNRMVNEITKNSLYSIGYAIYLNQKNNQANMYEYGTMDIDEALDRVQKRLNVSYPDEKYPFSRLEESHFKSNSAKNLIIFVQESLGYQFVEAVGGEKNITPHLNALAKESILFMDAYSNGTRSIRGLSGMSAGNFAVPGEGVIRKNKSQSDFFTLASLLKPLGYHTSFMYGGEAKFDDMRTWYLGNGFDQVIERKDFKNPTFEAPWGVCDEDLVVKGNEEFKKMYTNHQKFATVMFSQSNHTPFEYPYEKIEPIKDVPLKSVKNAVKYADYAIGKFIELAKQEDYYKDTIIVIVADHNVRVYGNDVVPVNMFHIPALILGGGIEPSIYKNITTQPDILATALDLMGLDLEYPIMGHSIYSDKKKNLALMQFHTYYALRVDDKIAVISPNAKPATFLYQKPKNALEQNNYLIPTKADNELEKDASAFVLVLDYLYENKLYKPNIKRKE